VKKILLLVCLTFSGLVAAEEPSDPFLPFAADASACSMEGEFCWNNPCCPGLVCTGGEWTRSCRPLRPCQSDAECNSWERCFAVGGGTATYCIP